MTSGHSSKTQCVCLEAVYELCGNEILEIFAGMQVYLNLMSWFRLLDRWNPVYHVLYVPYRALL